MAGDAPPAYAWDWLARQRLVWQETRRRLIAAHVPPQMAPLRAVRDVPDWAADHPDLTPDPSAVAVADLAERVAGVTDYRRLDTRAEVITALRADYPHEAQVRATVDAVVAEIAFLGRLDVPLAELGVRHAPRGMRWWWSHLTGGSIPAESSDAAMVSEPASDVPLQLRLVDVLAGYGDPSGR